MRIIIFITLLSSILFAFEFDKKVAKDDSDFIKAHYYVPRYSAVGVLAMALYEGSDSRLGKTSFEAVDAGIISQVVTEGIKSSTSRTRPRDSDTPNSWGDGGKSFPSGHVSGMTALITPYILEYQDDHPAIHTLWLLTIYQMVGRVKTQAHWQSDVTMGAIVGFGSGYLTHNFDIPIVLYFNKNNTFVGFKKRF